ncbi:hypothetical protein MHSWG343_09160 [Candidatus Mycoplasma haematohominis]|uniref:DUF4062 domain-containing protein n=1 Tax=Candidatus Mycoplasma haematohominis TaxID=1494318 RepID=A0A478FU04_9MOLU|nr:hypothetical protein MHSWG343_09160 [Candidatus Mycoplasma haemohominis]
MKHGKAINIYVSVAWNYENQLNELIKMLDKTGLNYLIRKIPLEDPVFQSSFSSAILAAMEEIMAGCDFVFYLNGVYEEYKKLIDIETKAVKNLKLISAVIDRWGDEKTSPYYDDIVSDEIPWDSDHLKNYLVNRK